MAGKTYTKEQRIALKPKLMEAGLALYAQHGIKNVVLQDILAVVGISKPFFYTFFDSVQEFVICLLDYQWGILRTLVTEIEQRMDLSWEEKRYTLFLHLIHHRENGLLLMTQEEEVWVARKLGEANVAAFLARQLDFFTTLLEEWGIDKERLSVEALGNMILSILIVHSSAQKSFPFLYLNALEESTQAEALALTHFLSTLRACPLK